MWSATAIFVTLACFSGALVGIAWAAAYRFAKEHERPQSLRWLLPWAAKGLLFPTALWIIMNLGVSWHLQPFMPQVQAARNGGGSWVPIFLNVIGAGLFAISSYWTAVTLGWILAKVSVSLEGELSHDYRNLCLAILAVMFVPALIILFLGGWMMAGIAVLSVLVPIVGYAPTVLLPKRTPPMYARAVARMKFGKYSAAEWEILHQLEKCENDFEGWMMLAELYATRFNDVAEAEQTILEICDQPRVTPSQISVALHKLADWRLNLTGDPDAARRALQVICDRLPGTHLGRMAQLRLSQLPRTAEELREQRRAHVIPLPALSESFDEAAGQTTTGLEPDQAAELVNQLSDRLTRNPDDVAGRERLARVLADQPGKADVAIEQVELLLGMSGQPDEKKAEWLSLIAAWQLRLKHDEAAARQAMHRLIREFPNSPQAFAAQRRLSLMDTELRMQQAKAAVARLKIAPEK